MELMTVKEVASFFKVSRTTVYQWLNDGKIKGVRLGDRLRFNRQDLEKMVLDKFRESESIEKVA